MSFLVIVLLIIIIYFLFNKKQENMTLSPVPANFTTAYAECAVEGAQCAGYSTPTVVYFGAGKDYITKQVTGPFACNTNFFGDDPAPSIKKSCYIPTTKPTITLPSGYIACGDNGDTCIPTGTQQAYYGNNGKYTTKTATGPFVCGIPFFGSDPAVNIVKSCYLPTNDGLPSGYVKCGNENEQCQSIASNLVYYGTGNNYFSKQIDGDFDCSVTLFGDPAANKNKACYIPIASAQEASYGGITLDQSYTVCAEEGGHCSVAGVNNVMFGSDNKFVAKQVVGGFDCNSTLFGDPNPGRQNACYVGAKY